MFELNGDTYSLDQVEDAAKQSNLSIEEYVSKAGLKKVQEEEAGKIPPQVPGAPVEETAAPDTVSKSEPTSLASQLIKSKPKKETISAGIGAPETTVETKPKEITYEEALSRLDSALAVSDEELANFFGQQYFDISKAPSKYYTDETYYSGLAGGMIKQVPDKEKNVREYLQQKNKLEEYESFQKDPVAFFNNLPAQTKNKFRKQRKEELAVNFYRILPEDEKLTFKSLIGNAENIYKDYSKSLDSFETQQKGFKSKYETDLGNIEYLEKEIKDWDNKNLAKLERVSHMIGANIFAGNQEKAEEFEQIRNQLINERKSLFNLYSQANESLQEKGYEADRDALLSSQDSLVKKFEDNKILYDNFGNIDASFKAAQYSYDLKDKAINQLKSTLFNVGGNVAAFGASGLKYLAGVNKMYGTAVMLDELSSSLSSFANDALTEQQDRFAPTIKIKDVKDFSDFTEMFLSTIADQASNIATVWGGGAIVNALSKTGSAISAINTVQKATTGLMGMYSGSAQYSTMDISQEAAELQLPELYAQREKILDPVEKNLLDERIHNLEQSFNLSELSKVTTAVGYGVTEALAERFGTMRVISQWSNFNKAVSGLKPTTKLLNLPKYLAKGIAVEEVEEIGTQIMQNTISSFVDDTVNPLDGVDLDFFTSTLFTSLVLQGPSINQTVGSVLGEMSVNKAERKYYKEKADRFITLLSEKQEAKQNGEKFNNNKEIRSIANELGRQSAINFVKLQNLPKQSIQDLFRNEAKKRQLLRQITDLGMSDIENQTKNARYQEALNELKSLEYTKETLLQNVFLKKYKGVDELGRTVERNVEREAEADFELAIMHFASTLTRNIVGDAKYIDVKTPEQLEDKISNLPEDKKKIYIDSFNEMRKMGSSGYFSFDLNTIFFNRGMVEHQVINRLGKDTKTAVNTPFHELGHWAIYNIKHNDAQKVALKRAADGLIPFLETKNLPKEVISSLKERVQQYEDLKEEIGADDYILAQEIMMAYFDLVNAGVINENEIETSRSLRDFIRITLNQLSPGLDMYANISTPEGIIEFLKDFGRKVKSQQLKATSPEDDEKLREVRNKAYALGQKELNDRVDNLVGKKDENGKYQWKSKQEFQNSEEFINVYDKIINGNLIDPLIRRGIEGDVIYGKPIERFIEDVKDGLTGTIMRFDPTVNNSLIGWINLQLGRRKGDVSNQYKKEFGEFGTTSIDIEAGEIGSLREIEAEDQAFDEAIDIEEQMIDETKGLIIPGVEVFGKEVNQELINEIKNIYADLQLDGKNYKTLPRLATKYVAEKAGVPEAKITDPKKNLSTGEYNSGSNFLASIVDTYIKILPEGAITQEAASEALRGTSTGLPKNVLNFAYTRNEERFKDPAGLFVFEKRKDLNKIEFLNAIGLNPDGTIKPGITGRSPESQTVKALLNLLDRIITNTAVRVVGGELGMSMNTQLDIRSGTVDGVFSLGLSSNEAKQQYKAFKGAVKYKLNKIQMSELADELIKLGNNMKTSDGPSGVQVFYLDKLKKHNKLNLDFIKLIPDNVFKNNITIPKGVTGNGKRINAAGAVYKNSKGINTVDVEWIERNPHKAFKNNDESENLNESFVDIANALLSNTDLNVNLGVDFAKSKIISEETRRIVEKFGFDKKLAPVNPSNINVNNWNQQMAKFDSKEWKSNIVLASRILQSIIVDITNYIDPTLNNESTQEQFDEWLGFVYNLYHSTTNNSTGFRQLSIVDVGQSYAYDYKRLPKDKEGKTIKNLLYAEHVPTNLDAMTDMMIDNIVKRRVSEIIPTVYIVPKIDAKAKDVSGLKNSNDVNKVNKFFASRRNKQKDQSRIIYYNKQEIAGTFSLGTQSLEDRFAGMISMKDPRITPGQKLDLATAKNLAATRKKRLDVITPGANDFDGLMYTLLAKGKLGEEQYEWIKKNLYEPYSEAHYKLNNTRQSTAIRLKKIQKENKELFKKLKKDSGFGGFTFEQALRVWLFQKAGYTPSGINEDTQDVLVKIVKKNKDIENLGKELSNILPMQEYWVEPDAETWQVDNIKTDVINAIEKVARKQFLDQWKNNVDQIFSKNNINKLVAAFGEDYVEVLKDMLYRMETGSSRPEGSNKQMNVFMNWVRGSVATTMFFNRRSAVLQQISNVNFLNWGDNNPIEAAKAFANQKQYWEDFVFILNSDYLKERRGGLKTDINAAELAEAVKKKGFKGALGKLLQAGFSLTQLGDSLAIATGGSTFYRNRINTYTKQGLTKEQAEKQAFLDFQELSEETQQSARPDRLSQQQTTVLGRVFLSFQNTPMQMTRLSVKAGKDLLTGRGDPKEKVFKMLYYGAIQSIIFSLLQTALIGDMFGVFEDDEDDDYTELKAKKTKRVVNGVVDSFLKGTGVYGVTVATVKNALITLLEQEERKEKGKRPDYTYVLLQGLNISPPVGIKARNFYGALKNYEYNAKYVGAAGFNLNNPAVDIGSATVESLFNIPALSTVTTLRDINTAVTEDLEIASRLALLAGWHTWDLGLEDKKLDKIKAEVKEVNKQLRESKKPKRKIINL